MVPMICKPGLVLCQAGSPAGADAAATRLEHVCRAEPDLALKHDACMALSLAHNTSHRLVGSSALLPQVLAIFADLHKLWG